MLAAAEVMAAAVLRYKYLCEGACVGAILPLTPLPRTLDQHSHQLASIHVATMSEATVPTRKPVRMISRLVITVTSCQKARPRMNFGYCVVKFASRFRQHPVTSSV